MSNHITSLPLPFVTNVIVDTRAVDVSVRVDPAMFLAHAVTPGEIIPPDDRKTGISLSIQKGHAVSIIALLENGKASELVEALVTGVVRGDPEQMERAEEILERVQRAITAGFETPAVLEGRLGVIDSNDDPEGKSDGR